MPGLDPNVEIETFDSPSLLFFIVGEEFAEIFFEGNQPEGVKVHVRFPWGLLVDREVGGEDPGNPFIEEVDVFVHSFIPGNGFNARKFVGNFGLNSGVI